MRKGQVTVFVIIGLVLLITVGILFFMMSAVEEEKIPEDIKKLVKEREIARKDEASQRKQF